MLIFRNITKYFNHFICLQLLVLALTAVVYPQDEEKQFMAIITPFVDRIHADESETPLELNNLKIFVFLYKNAALVYMEEDLMNTGPDTVYQDLAIPSTGYVENDVAGDPFTSNGILNPKLWVQMERKVGEELIEGNETWYSMNVTFPPDFETRVKALFWVQTSLTDVDSVAGLDTLKIDAGRRALFINISKATYWKNAIGQVDVRIVMMEGLSTKDPAFVAEPDNYDLSDSTLSWELYSIEPSIDDNIRIDYLSGKTKLDTMMKLGAFIQKKGYDDLTSYVEDLEEE